MAKDGKPVVIRIGGDASLFKKSVKGVGKSLNGLQKTAKAAGKAIGAGLAVGAVGIIKMGTAFEGVERTLRVGTGATGEALEGLKDITKSIATSVPADFQDIGTAVADINTRLGFSGQELESFSTQMLNLSRITGTDLQTNIASVTRALGDWGAGAGDAETAADTLFTVAQMTGIEFNKLSDSLVNYGAPLRQVGFTFEESAVMIGKFEKEGVNAELVLGSLRQALGKMAREGEPAIETFRRTVKAIEDAGDASEANKKALELFGARAGPDMAAAIREGRFELDDYFKQMESGGDTINAATAETETLGEKMTLLKNRVMMTLAPVVERAFSAIEQAFRKIEPHVERLIEGFKEFTQSERFQEIKKVVVETLGKIGEVIKMVTEKVRDFFKDNPEALFAALAVVIGTILVGAVVALITTLGTLLSPVALVVGAIAALTAGLTYAYNEFETVKTIMDIFASFFKDVVWPIIKNTTGLIADAFQAIFTTVSTVVSGVKALFELDLSEALKSLVTSIPTILTNLLSGTMSLIKGIGRQLGQWIVDGIKALISEIDLGDVLGGLADAAGGLLGKLNPFKWSGKGRATQYSSGGSNFETYPSERGGIASQLDLSAGSMGWFQNPETIMHFQQKGLMDVFRKLRAAGNVAGLSDVVHMGQGTGGFEKMTNDQIRVNINIEGSVVTETELVETIRVGLIESQNSGNQLVVAS